MLKKSILYTCYIFLGLLNCKAQLLEIKSDNDRLIIVVFNNMPDYADTIRVSPKIALVNSNSIIAYYDGYLKTEFNPKRLDIDTLKIKAQCAYIRLTHRFNTFSSMDFFVKQGDTVIFNYQAGMPIASLKNIAHYPFDIDYERLIRLRLPKVASFTPWEIYKTPFFTKDTFADPNMIVNQTYKIKIVNYQLAKNGFNNELRLLDSLKKVDLISENHYRFYTDRAIYLTKAMDVEQNANAVNSNLELPERNYFTCQYSYFYDYLQAYIFATTEKKAPTIHQSNGQIADYRYVFDNVSKLTTLNPVHRDMLLHKYFLLIANNFPYTDFKKYYAKAVKLIADTALISDINEKILTLDPKLDDKKNILTFLNREKKVSTLKNLLAENKGKIIYIDFWASWCVPCRAAMPQSHILRERYKNAPVLFVYISLDKDFGQWTKAAKAEGIADYSHSFIIPSQDNDSFFKTYKLYAIPRYFLYDRNGKLINSNAPGPTSNRLQTTLNNLIK
jgi:thiol-disulfide isomerase/thioredoxin